MTGAASPAADVPRALAAPLEGIALVEAETPAGRLWLDADDRLLTPAVIADGEYDAPLSRFLGPLLRPGMTFLDVGANIGYFSAFAARRVSPGGRVIAVEPNPSTVALLRANLWRNGAACAEVLAMAAGDRTGHVGLVGNPEGRSGVEVDPAGGQPTLVPCARLDDLLTGPVDVLKCDAQGFDHLVVRGLETTIARSPGFLGVVEFFTTAPMRGSAPAEILAYYRSLGLTLGMLSDSGPIWPTDAQILAVSEHHLVIDLILRRP